MTNETNQKSTPEAEALLDLEAVVALLGQIPYADPAVKKYSLKTIQLMAMKARETLSRRALPAPLTKESLALAALTARWFGGDDAIRPDLDAALEDYRDAVRRLTAGGGA